MIEGKLRGNPLGMWQRPMVFCRFSKQSLDAPGAARFLLELGVRHGRSVGQQMGRTDRLLWNQLKYAQLIFDEHINHGRTDWRHQALDGLRLLVDKNTSKSFHPGLSWTSIDFALQGWIRCSDTERTSMKEQNPHVSHIIYGIWYLHLHMYVYVCIYIYIQYTCIYVFTYYIYIYTYTCIHYKYICI